MMRKMLALGAMVMALAASTASAAEVLVEAEAFQNPGGWVVDQQFMDQMGSPYLLAHGLGVPVANAATEVQIPQAGRYSVWVRTKDWVPPHRPGRFKVLLGGKTIEKEFGTEGEGWLWQDGGTVDLPAGAVKVELQDLTGFEGRCDAIYLTTDAAARPPAKPDAAMRTWRKRLLGLPSDPPEAGEFDLVVIGGGTAGSASAAAAAQKGLKVALIQDRPVFGGNSSPDVRVPIAGLRAGEKDAKVYEVTKKNLGLMKPGLKNVENLSVFLWTHAFAVEKDGPRIKAVIAQHCLTSKELRFRAPLFVDCTGDGTIGLLAGADYRYGREARAETGEPLALPDGPDEAHMGMSLYGWKATDRKEPSAFPDCPWAIRITDENFEAAVIVQPPKDPAELAKLRGAAGGDWTWEAGFFDKVPENDELVRDRLFRAIYGVWDYQKNRSPDKARWQNWKLTAIPHVGGKRESRRLMGDVILAQRPKGAEEYPDAIVSLGWGTDIHYPTDAQRKFFPGEEFRSWFWKPPFRPSGGGGVGHIPYRSLYSRSVPNLFMAGRCISTTHVAMGATRVMGTGAKCGTVTGLAASLCRKHNCAPRELYEKHLQELMALLADPGI